MAETYKEFKSFSAGWSWKHAQNWDLH